MRLSLEFALCNAYRLKIVHTANGKCGLYIYLKIGLGDYYHLNICGNVAVISGSF